VTELPLSGGWSALVAVIGFFGNSIGCVLATFCLVRVIDESRRQRDRVRLAVVAGVALVECAYTTAIFGAAAVMELDDIDLSFTLMPGLAIAAASMMLTCGALVVVTLRPTRPTVIVCGAAVGVSVATASLEALASVQIAPNVALDLADAAWIAIGLALVGLLWVGLTVGARRRRPVAAAIMSLALALTAGQYLLTGEVLVEAHLPIPNSSGLSRITIVVAGGVALIVRTIVLTLFTVGDTSDPVRRERRPVSAAGG
jgi:hypothetical protein